MTNRKIETKKIGKTDHNFLSETNEKRKPKLLIIYQKREQIEKKK